MCNAKMRENKWTVADKITAGVCHAKGGVGVGGQTGL